MQILKYDELSAKIPLDELSFTTTEQLIEELGVFNPHVHGWIAQAEAKKAAMFGLNIPQRGFNLLVLGKHGSGRTSLMLSAMAQVSNKAKNQLHDLIALFDFEQTNQPVLMKLPVGLGAQLREEMAEFMRLLMMELPNFSVEKTQQAMLDKADPWLDTALETLNKSAEGNDQLKRHIFLMKCDVLAYLKTWQLPTSNELEGQLEGLVNEAYLARFRVNLLVDNRVMQAESLNQPLVYDNDPSHQSLFGWLESSPDSPPDFLRLRAGNLHKADGGVLLLHLRDLLNDEQNGSQVIEKLYRFLRNGTLQFEDSTSSAHSTGYVLSNTLLPLKVKLVLVAMREDFFSLLGENPGFFDYFPIKVEFADSVNATVENFAAIAGFVAQKCAQHNCQHFSNDAVAALIGALQRLEEDQARISTNFAYLERLILESASCAADVKIVTSAHVEAAIAARNQRHQYFETQIRESIIDNELLIQVDGQVVGQVNGLTHVELGDTSFGSPIRITARCYPGQKGLINIDREVKMSGPNHDKGIFILQNWLSASFSHLAPLSLNASLVFEQEYSGVEGDSASCAELFALLSALANLPVQQGIAVTGALNQFGEVMPIGGVNEKIEGYFRVCKALGLNGKQGVIIPKRNQRHLLLDDEVVDAVKNGQFHIIAINHVLEGIQHLVGLEAGRKSSNGKYPSGTVMGHVQAVLAEYRKTFESNRPQGGSSNK